MSESEFGTRGNRSWSECKLFYPELQRERELKRELALELELELGPDLELDL